MKSNLHPYTAGTVSRHQHLSIGRYHQHSVDVLDATATPLEFFESYYMSMKRPTARLIYLCINTNSIRLYHHIVMLIICDKFHLSDLIRCVHWPCPTDEWRGYIGKYGISVGRGCKLTLDLKAHLVSTFDCDQF